MAELHCKPETSLIPDSWGISRMNVVTIKYLWKIENYSYWDKKGEEHIGSPYFFIDKMQDTKWQMRLYHKSLYCGPTRADSNSFKSMVSLRLLLISSNESSVKAKCKFSLNRGVVLNESGEMDFHTFKKNISSSLVIDLELDEERSNSNDIFTIVCEINMCKGSIYIPGPSAAVPDEQVSKKSHLSDFENLLHSGRLSDVMLIVKDGVSIPAHKSILAARSPVFAAIFEAQIRDSKSSDVSVVEIEECVMRELLRYVYADRVENIDEIVMRLLQAADRYKIDSLKNLCVDNLARKIDANNAEDILQLAKEYNLESLKRKAVNVLAVRSGNPMIWLNPEEVVYSETPEQVEIGTLQKVKRVVKSKILETCKIFQ